MPFVISGDLKRICETELSLRYLIVVSQNMCSRLVNSIWQMYPLKTMSRWEEGKQFC
ncbi:unnamed protein product [Brassica rapa subsp. trilocularis]|uniref:Uncharacterized protein n=1 Tax=Brassica campestris TaxID=3711 RepID=A0A3P5XZ14_BRACM|nr:unnamed protein product [Brassica rapa]